VVDVTSKASEFVYPDLDATTETVALAPADSPEIVIVGDDEYWPADHPEVERVPAFVVTL